MKRQRIIILVILIVTTMILFMNFGCHIGSKDCHGPGEPFWFWCGKNMCVYDESDEIYFNGASSAKYNEDYKMVVYDYEIEDNKKISVIFDCLALEQIYDLNLEIFIKSNGIIVGNESGQKDVPQCFIVKSLNDSYDKGTGPLRALTGSIEIDLYNYKGGNVEIIFDYVSAIKK